MSESSLTTGKRSVHPGAWSKRVVPSSLSEQWVFPFMGTRTASPRGRYGERPQRDSVWRYICKNTTCWPATAHDVTTGVPQYKCRRENTSSAFSSSLTGLFEACRVNLVRVQFSNSTMASTSKAFRKCVDPCPRYLTPDDTHDCCIFCLGMEHARDVASCTRCFVAHEGVPDWPAESPG